MNDKKRSTVTAPWDDEIERNSQLFFEADRLDQAAYKILGEGARDAQAWNRFTRAKQLADQKYTEAYQDWMRIKRLMSD
jgi:hypothetical protein